MADRCPSFTGTAPGRFLTRRLGLPADVAETTARLAHPASGAVNGQVVRVCAQVVRVCGQSLLEA